MFVPMQDVGTRAGLTLVRESRGQAIKRRRTRHGIDSYVEFADAVGIYRQTVKRAEEGRASDRTYNKLETWLERFEEECGAEEDAADPLPTDLVEYHIKSDVVDVVVRGTSSNAALLEASVLKLLDKMQGRPTEG